MIKDRKLAEDIKGKCGTKEDVSFLMRECFLGKICDKDRDRVLDYWVKKKDKTIVDFRAGKIKLGDVKNEYLKLKVVQSFFGGEIISNKK